MQNISRAMDVSTLNCTAHILSYSSSHGNKLKISGERDWYRRTVVSDSPQRYIRGTEVLTFRRIEPFEISCLLF